MRVERLGTAALAAALSACGPGIDVRSDWDPSVDFSNFETFAVLDEATDAGLSGFVGQRIKIAFTNTMESRDLRLVENRDDADIEVGWQVTTDQRSTFQTVTTGWSGYSWGRCCGPSWGMGMSTSRTTERRYEVGALVLAVFDVNREDLIFQSEGSKTRPNESM